MLNEVTYYNIENINHQGIQLFKAAAKSGRHHLGGQLFQAYLFIAAEQTDSSVFQWRNWLDPQTMSRVKPQLWLVKRLALH